MNIIFDLEKINNKINFRNIKLRWITNLKPFVSASFRKDLTTVKQSVGN